MSSVCHWGETSWLTDWQCWTVNRQEVAEYLQSKHSRTNSYSILGGAENTTGLLISLSWYTPSYQEDRLLTLRCDTEDPCIPTLRLKCPGSPSGNGEGCARVCASELEGVPPFQYAILQDQSTERLDCTRVVFNGCQNKNNERIQIYWKKSPSTIIISLFFPS